MAHHRIFSFRLAGLGRRASSGQAAKYKSRKQRKNPAQLDCVQTPAGLRDMDGEVSAMTLIFVAKSSHGLSIR